ncbi:MAG: KOW domain-containing RNA-binding protein [Oscillospiraceae bacterium]|nr:KOW domain-containing RNA-binding protein [Oscillospiraceae bacterium]
MQRLICQAGTIVLAKAGRDAGRFFVVTAMDGMDLLIADGKTRKLENPKRKNPVHVQKTAGTVELEGLTDASLRRILQPLNEKVSGTYSKQNQIRKEVIDDVEVGCN